MKEKYVIIFKCFIVFLLKFVKNDINFTKIKKKISLNFYMINNIL